MPYKNPFADFIKINFRTVEVNNSNERIAAKLWNAFFNYTTVYFLIGTRIVFLLGKISFSLFSYGFRVWRKGHYRVAVRFTYINIFFISDALVKKPSNALYSLRTNEWVFVINSEYIYCKCTYVYRTFKLLNDWGKTTDKATGLIYLVGKIYIFLNSYRNGKNEIFHLLYKLAGVVA